MFTFAAIGSASSRNTRQIIRKIKPSFCNHHQQPLRETALIPSNFSTTRGYQVQGKNLTNFEKRILVFNKNYPTLNDVPDSVSLAELNKAKDWTRVKVSLFSVFLTVMGCIAMTYFGRQAVKRGEGIQKLNLEWHKRYNEEAKKAEEDASQKKE